MRQAAKKEIREHLEKECNKLKAELRTNRWDMKRLIEKQTLTKRKIAEYFTLMKHLDGDSPKKEKSK